MCFDPGADLTAADLAAAWSDEQGDLVVDDRAVPRDTPLVDCGLADGATVAVGRAPVVRPRLVVVAGPVPSTDVPIDGTVLIGRGAACDLRLDHPSIRPAHALVEGTTACSLDGATWLDGVPLHGPQPLRAGSVLSVGAVDLQVLGEDPPAVVTPPRSPVHRAARPPDEAVADPGPAPEPPPETPPPSPPGVLTVVGPLVVGVVLAVLVHPTAGLVTVGWPIIAVGSHLDARRRHRRDGRTADAAHAEAVDAHRRAAEDARRHEADRERRNFPTIVDALHRARSGVDLWPVRDATDLAVGWSDDLRRAPVVTDSRLGVAGPRPWARQVANALAAQAATRCRGSPEIEVAERADRLTDRCTAMLVWSTTGARFSDRADGRRDVPVRPFVAGDELGDEVRRTCARWSDPDEDRGLPDEVGLADLDLTPRPGLAVPLGIGPDGPVVVDLVADGPHALVAGTTGAGKSELLRTWVVALAATHPPTALTFVLVDYKGGSAFDACARLPHVTGVVTDLDPGLGERLLVGLRAEVREREAALRAAGANDLRDVPSGPPRLVVVVDEFATLAAELPDFLGALVDVARRGRSLGLHLVLATQRPAGAVSDDIRANTALRLCLRTLDTADSQDVLGTADAADLPAPGRAWLRRGGEPEVLQVATGSRPTPDEPPAARRADRRPALRAR